MGLEVVVDGLAHVVVLLERLDLLDLAEGVEGVVVEVVDVADVRVLDDGVGEVLHVSDAVGDPGWRPCVSRGGCSEWAVRARERGRYLVGSSVRT